MAESARTRPPTGDVIDKIVSMASETIGKSADLNSITGDKKNRQAQGGHVRHSGVSADKTGQSLRQATAPRRQPGVVRPSTPGEL